MATCTDEILQIMADGRQRTTKEIRDYLAPLHPHYDMSTLNAKIYKVMNREVDTGTASKELDGRIVKWKFTKGAGQ